MSDMKLVPVHPDDAMLKAAYATNEPFRPRAVWEAMLSAAPVVSVGGLSGSSAQEADTHRATDKTVLAFRILYDCAQDVRKALDAEPAMQGPKYRSLGITFTTALDVAREALRDHQAATPDGSQPTKAVTIEIPLCNGMRVTLEDASDGRLVTLWNEAGDPLGDADLPDAVRLEPLPAAPEDGS